MSELTCHPKTGSERHETGYEDAAATAKGGIQRFGGPTSDES